MSKIEMLRREIKEYKEKRIFSVYGIVDNEKFYERKLTLIEAIESFNKHLEGNNIIKLELELSGIEMDLKLMWFADGVKVVEHSSLKYTEFDKDKFVLAIIRELKNENDIELDFLEQIQDDLIKYESYELYDDWMKNNEGEVDYKLMLIAELDTVVIDIEDGEGKALNKVDIIEFISLTKHGFDILLGEILNYNWIENEED